MNKFNLAILTAILLSISIAVVYAETTVTQQVTVTVLPGEINIYSPEEGAIYSDRMIPINLDMSSETTFKYSDDTTFRTLCRNCNSYNGKKPFGEGMHELTIKAIFATGEVEEKINFIVDSKKPKITKTEPTRNFATGDFSVEFQEENAKEIWLNYGNDNTGWKQAGVNLDECYKINRNKMRCNVKVDLIDYDLQEIKYWFNISDILNRTDESKARKLDADVSMPVLNNPENFYVRGEGRQSRYVYFTFNVTEINFDKINYIDYSEGDKAKFRALCSSLKNGICAKRKSFKIGEHNLTIEILDKAGNREIVENVIFTIV